jgi:ACS family tartrate transporter-like MFS transporter
MLFGGPAKAGIRIDVDEGLPVRTRKHVTRRLIPYLVFIYFLAYLDRANLGVAKLRMQTDLGFSDAVIGLGAGIFFLGYLLLDIPGSLIVERWSARKWIARIMISWGMVAALMGLLGTPAFSSVRPVTQFYGLRLLLGIAEAGFFPGVIVYLSHWYRAEDRARAKAYFMITQPLAIAIGVPLSRWILDNVGWFGLAGWRWVFILEGIPPVLMGIVTLWYLTDRPHKADWLADDEKQWLIAQLKAEEAIKVSAGRVRAIDALRHPQTFLLIAIFFLIVTGNQALIFFLPSIAETMKSTPVAVRTIAAGLPYACSAMGILLNGIWAHRTGALRWHTAGPMLATGISLALAVLADRTTAGPGWLMMGLFCLAGFTAQAYLPAFFTLPTILLGRSAAATAVGLICLGNLGGFAGPWLFGYLKTLTGRYDTGLWVLAGCMLLAGTLATQIRVPPISHAVSRNE